MTPDLPTEKFVVISEGKKRSALSDQKSYQVLPSHKGPWWQVAFTQHLLPFPRFIRSPFALFFNDDLVIHAKLALWHSTQITLHHHSARDVGTQNLTWCREERNSEHLCNPHSQTLKGRKMPAQHLLLTLGRHQEIHALQHIKKEFVTTVFDPFASPAYLSSHLAGDLGLLFLSLKGRNDILDL